MILFYLLLIIILFKIALFILNFINYQQSSYKQNTNNSFFHIITNSGSKGEYQIYDRLKDYEILNAKFLFNLYIPTKNNKTTEIDVIMISQKSIFVFESKNYSGWIFGSDKEKYWTQTLPSYKKHCVKSHFYNPIRQNDSHIKYLKRILNNENLKFISYIVFSNHCQFKKLKNTTQAEIIHQKELKTSIGNIYNNLPNIISISHIEAIYNQLYKYTQVSIDIKQNHLKNLKKYKHF